MRKLLIGFLIAILLVLFGVIVIKGFQIGKISLGYSIRQIIDTNDELDAGIVALGAKIETEYKQAKTNLEQSFANLQNEKQTYQDKIAYTTSEDLSAISETEKYKLDYLWTNIGLYATKNNLELRADLTHGSSGVPNQYNISFTTIGDYVSIAEFIYAIEKDPNMGFRIEEFALVPYSEEKLQGTFIIKNITMVEDSINNSVSTPSSTASSGTESSSGGTNSQNAGGNTANTASQRSNTNTTTNTATP